jgi:hypothetical protein
MRYITKAIPLKTSVVIFSNDIIFVSYNLCCTNQVDDLGTRAGLVNWEKGSTK